MANAEEPTTGAAWQLDVMRVLKQHGVKHVVYVPDAGHTPAIRMAESDPEITAVVLTSEQEGIGYLAGAWLGGERGALLMQSSGVGNCINTLALQVQDFRGQRYQSRLPGTLHSAVPYISPLT